MNGTRYISERRGVRRARAFTLIEIMIVVAIMGIVLTMGIPAIYNIMHRSAMPQAIVDVREACSKARARAIMHGIITEVRFYPMERRLEVADAPMDAAPGEIPGALGATSLTPPKTDTNTAVGFKAQISDRVIIQMLDINFIEYKDAQEARVRFLPNGTCDELTLVLRSADGRDQRKITLELATAITDVGPVE